MYGYHNNRMIETMEQNRPFPEFRYPYSSCESLQTTLVKIIM